MINKEAQKGFKAFSILLKKLREDRGLTQAELANILGVSRGAISYYEKGERVADVDFLYKVADFFKVSTDYLLGLSEYKTNNADITAVCDYTGLSVNAVKTLHVYVETAQMNFRELTNEEGESGNYTENGYTASGISFQSDSMPDETDTFREAKQDDLLKSTFAQIRFESKLVTNAISQLLSHDYSDIFLRDLAYYFYIDFAPNKYIAAVSEGKTFPAIGFNAKKIESAYQFEIMEILKEMRSVKRFFIDDLKVIYNPTQKDFDEMDTLFGVEEIAGEEHGSDS